MSREMLFSLLGDKPEVKNPTHQTISVRDIDTYTVETLLLDLNGIEGVPAYFIKPKDKEGPFPLVLFHHSHGGNYTLGREEVLVGNHYLQSVSFSKELTDMGYAVLAIDTWGFNERSGKKESEIFKEMLITGKVMWGMMMYDNIHALDYVLNRSDIDNDRVANIGMSMGGMTAWWLAALDERIKVTIDIGGQADMDTLIESRLLDKHNFYYYVPKLHKFFSTFDVQSFIAPRKRLSLVGRYDSNCPIEGVYSLKEKLTSLYEIQGCPTHFKQVITSGGHQETSYMRAEWKEFLRKNL